VALAASAAARPRRLAWSRIRTIHAASFDHRPCDGGGLAAGEEPAGGGGGQWHPDDCEREIEDGDGAQGAEVVVVGGREGGVGAGDAEERGEEGECAGGGGGQGAADAGGCSGRGQGAEVAGALAADQADGHGEDGEREEGSGGGRDRHGLRRRVLLPANLDREA